MRIRQSVHSLCIDIDNAQSQLIIINHYVHDFYGGIWSL